MLKSIIVLIFSGLILISLQACKQSQEQPSTKTPTIYIDSKIGKNAASILRTTEPITFFFVSPKLAFPHYKVDSSEILLTGEIASELQQLLLNDDHYVKKLNKLTMFLPYIAFKFHKKNAGDIVLLLSPDGDQIKIMDGNNNFILDYDPAKILFDNFIQKLEQQYPQ